MILFLVLSMVAINEVTCWDENAGIVGSLTKRPGVKVIASSNQKDANKAIDNNDNTQWISASCLPTNFISQESDNILLNSCQDGRCTSSSGSTNLNSATDGKWDTSFHAKPSNGKAELHVKLSKDTPIRYLGVGGRFYAPTTLTIDHGSDHKTVKVLNTNDNYQKEAFSGNNASALMISITSDQAFDLKEIAALGPNGCIDRLIVDLGKVETVGTIRVRSWPGEETFYSKLLTSLDMQTWHKVADINPKVVEAQTFKVDPPVQARYIAVEHNIHTKEWVKSYVWEVDAFGSTSNFGASPKGSPNPNSLHQMFGVNGIWGWGSRGPSKNLKSGEGAFLYDQIASNARNYHQLLWDIKKPGNKARYDLMAQGHGTDGESWLNWDTEYNLWVKANLSVDASIQFKADKLPPSSWPNPKQDAYQFGKDFAEHFGPTKGNGLITAAEVGNEPWDYLHDFYSTILEGMAKGLKDGDPGIKVLPAAFQADDKTAENPPWHANYIGTRISQEAAKYLDAVNGHFYSFVKKPDGTRICSYPEDPLSEFNGMKNLIRWRDENMPGKGVWITEYGWDSAGAGETCTYSECVSERAASVYGIRALLIMARLGIERAIWFFYANLDQAECNPSAQHIFCRSGLTGSKQVNFAKKKTFDIHKYFLDYVGDKHFLQMVKEDKDAYVYILGDMGHAGSSPIATHVVAWRPIDGDDTSSYSVSFQMRAHSKSAKYITPNGLTFASLPHVSVGFWTVSLKSEPIIIEVDNYQINPGFSPIG